jgi:hypothetical protein
MHRKRLTMRVTRQDRPAFAHRFGMAGNQQVLFGEPPKPTREPRVLPRIRCHHVVVASCYNQTPMNTSAVRARY